MRDAARKSSAADAAIIEAMARILASAAVRKLKEKEQRAKK